MKCNAGRVNTQQIIDFLLEKVMTTVIWYAIWHKTNKRETKNQREDYIIHV